MMHRTHMGVDNNWQSLLLQAMRNALSDGWGGSMIATEVSDILFGVPTPRPTTVNAGVSEERPGQHRGSRPQPGGLGDGFQCLPVKTLLVKLAETKGAAGINLVGVCCTGNELLMRRMASPWPAITS
jgi:carbon-monoxide dehydrogenase catalytic subunit